MLGTRNFIYSLGISILAAEMHPACTQPRGSLNNMHPNLAWTLVAGWGLEGGGGGTHKSQLTHPFTHTGKEARTTVKSPQQAGKHTQTSLIEC